MGYAAQGTVLRRGDGGSPTEVFTGVGEVVDLDGPDGSASEVDMTHLQSAAKEFVMGLPDEGQVTVNGNFVGSDAQQQGLHSDRANQVLRNFEMEFADQPPAGSNNTKFAFSAYVLRFAVSARTDGKLGFSATLRISGAVTPTWAS